MKRAIFVTIFWVFCSVPLAAAAAERVALVVGNNAYESSPKLANPANDAVLISASLREVGFEVITAIDTTHRQLLNAISEFGRKSQNAEVSLFFYAGHGLEVAGRNWILPINANVETASDLPSTAIKINDVLETMDLSGARIRLIILDACRNNPLSRSLTRSSGRGLAKIDASAAGTMIVFAAAPGEVAVDGAGKNSPFTAALASHITREGLEVRQMLGRVRQDVMAATDDRQVPWVNEAIVGDLFMAGASEPADRSQQDDQPTTNPNRSSDISVELAFWDSVKDSGNAQLIELYLEKYPDGAFAGIAAVILASLDQDNPGVSRGDEPQEPDGRQAALDLMEQDARSFVQRINRTLSGPADAAIDQIGSLYARNVRFHGKLFSLNDILSDKRNLMKRWPQRNYSAPESEVNVSCDQVRQKCEVQSNVYWEVYSPARRQRANGVQRTYLELDFSTGIPKVVYESAENITGN